MSDPARLPAFELARRIARKELSAREALAAFLARIDRHNPVLNAVVTQDRAAAERRAAEADAALAAGRTWGPLHGVPMTVKDAFEVAGLRSTGGSPQLAGHVPQADAAAIARLRAAGANIFGKTNVPLFSGDFQSYNAVFGTSLNPWDRQRTPGGSSGGAAAAVAAGLTAAEFGSDIGGSIRIPAHFCGLFGHKPTAGLVPLRGHVPPPPGRLYAVDHLAVAGPLARCAEDLRLLLGVAAGETARALPAPRRLSPRGLRIAVWADDPFAPSSAAIAAAARAAADTLRAAGAEVDHEARPDVPFAAAFETYALMMHAVIQAGLPEKVRAKVARQADGADPGDCSHPVLQGRAAALSYAGWMDLEERRAVQQEAWRLFFRNYDAVLCPAAMSVAIPVDESPDINARTIRVDGTVYPYFDLMKWSTHASLGGLPATVAPAGAYEGGLPVGVQIVGPAGEDMTTIAIAAMLERETGGFAPPPDFA